MASVGLISAPQLWPDVSKPPETEKVTVPTSDERLTHVVHPHIVVKKGERKLELYSEKTLLKTYRIALGFNPEPDKQREGDGATPEGEFYVFVKNHKSAYYLSLGLSYPNEEDAARGLKAGLLNPTEHAAILTAIRAKKRPPQYTKLGGLIYIHGHGTASDWTLGCVALENDDIKELFDVVEVGTPVTIMH
jgi:murein L,D-transpeptidase YafK